MSRNSGSGENTVLVDMDGVMADFEEPNNGIIRAHFPHITPIQDRTDFYFKDTYREHGDVVERVEAEVRRPGFIRGFPMVEGADDGWQRILKEGYTPRVCSSPLENHETIIEEKKDWLEEYFVPRFGPWVVDTAIFDRDKSGYDAFAAIDDRPTLRNADRATWRHIVFDRSYNRSIDTDFRLHGWYDDDLGGLLARARARYRLI